MPPLISHQIVPCNWNNVSTSFGYPEPYSDRIICPTGRLDVRNVQSNKYDLFGHSENGTILPEVHGHDAYALWKS